MVDADGTQLGVIDREKALEVAQERELDLVLVSEKADPPVCRIMDYGKYKFEQEKKPRRPEEIAPDRSQRGQDALQNRSA